jgi:CIC family chloride channel protein
MVTSPRALAARWPRLSEHLFMVLVAIVCGVAGAVGAICFRFLIRVFQEMFFGGPQVWWQLWAGTLPHASDDPLALGLGLPWYGRLLAPAVGGLIVGPLIYYLAREARGHGVPEVMEAVALRGGTIRPRVVAVKALASALCIGSGGSVGREGPIVQIGSALASTLGQLLRVPARQLRTLVGCGAAAGIAATFNAPIAGALFAVEIILGDFAVPQFSPIVISSVVATVLSRLFLGNFPAFEVPAYELVSPLELGPYMLVGVLAGLVGVAFVAALYAFEDGFERVRLPDPLKAGLGGLLVGTIGIQFPHVFGVGYGSINEALAGALPLGLLAVLLLAKIVATSLTIGSGGSGGVFAPSLFLGAMTGGLFGSVVHAWFPESTASSGAYALVTMGAVVAATTHAPITAIIMIFELTQTITIIPPLMAACVVSTLVASFLRRDSIYTLKLQRRGVDLLAEEDPNVLKRLFVRDVIDREPEILPASASFPEVLGLVVRSSHTAFFVVSDRDELLGTISVPELRRLILEEESLRHVVVAADLVEPRSLSVREDDNLDLVMQLFSRTSATEIAVANADDPRRLAGSIQERDVIEAYNRETLRRDLAGGVTSRVTLAGRGHSVELGGGYIVEEFLAPRTFLGRTLRELDLRARTDVQVLLLRRRTADEKPALRVPTPDDRIVEGDVLVVVGAEAAVAQLKASAN